MDNIYLCDIGFHPSSVNPYGRNFFNSRSPSEDWTQLSTVEAASTEGTVARIVYTIYIRMDIL